MDKKSLKEDIMNSISEIGHLGASIVEIGKRVMLERHTLSKYLTNLKEEHFLDYAKVGKAKLWFINKAPIQAAFSATKNMGFSEKVLTEIVSNIPEALIVMDQDYKIQYINKRMQMRYGEIEGKYFQFEVLSMKDPVGLEGINEVISDESACGFMNCIDKYDNRIRIKASRLINPDKSVSIIALIEEFPGKIQSNEGQPIFGRNDMSI
jgi:hypothetical protein